MRQCDFFGIDKNRLSRKMQIFCRKVKIANSVVSDEDINMRMVGNCSPTHFNQGLPKGFLALGPTDKKLLSVKFSLFSPKNAISATVGPITISTTDLKSLKKVRKHCNSLYIAKCLPFLCYINLNVILGPRIAGGTLIVSYVAH